MNTEPIVLREDNQGIARIVLQRVEKHNALNVEMLSLLNQMLAHCEKASYKLVVIEAKGESFCAGADLKWMQSSLHYTPKQNKKDAALLADVFFRLYHLPQPTIALVQGHCLGGGIGLVTACDIALASDKAAFRFSEVKLGLIPATIVPYVIRAIGERHTRRYLLSAEMIEAISAKQIGLVHEVISHHLFQDKASAFLQMLLNNSPAAMRAVKTLITDVAHKILTPKLIAKTANAIAAVRVTPEAQEGLSAFLEKRKPDWKT
ncbi:MAG: enoyl-CoA hydratase [Gammaproteobacteria bacterium]|jgi:methylglutaconyl-CoA hydratase|nr:enoyl-CoA hydratase [Gammaproteobacteria bacterium]